MVKGMGYVRSVTLTKNLTTSYSIVPPLSSCGAVLEMMSGAMGGARLTFQSSIRTLPLALARPAE